MTCRFSDVRIAVYQAHLFVAAGWGLVALLLGAGKFARSNVLSGATSVWFVLLFVSYTLHARGGSTPARSSSAYVCSHASAHSIAALVHTTDTRHAEVAVACAWAGDRDQTTCVQVVVVRARHRRWGGADVSLRRRVALGLSAHCVSRLREINRERRLAGRLCACGRQHMPASTRTHVYNHELAAASAPGDPSPVVSLRALPGLGLSESARHVPVRPSSLGLCPV